MRSLHDPVAALESDFQANLVSTVIFYMVAVTHVSSFFANYAGAPFLCSITENKLLFRALLGFFGLLVLLVLEALPFLNDFLSLVPFPDRSVFFTPELAASEGGGPFSPLSAGGAAGAWRDEEHDSAAWRAGNLFFESVLGGFATLRVKVLLLMGLDVVVSCGFGSVVKQMRLAHASSSHERHSSCGRLGFLFPCPKTGLVCNCRFSRCRE